MSGDYQYNKKYIMTYKTKHPEKQVECNNRYNVKRCAWLRIRNEFLKILRDYNY
jgi:hypothetical protein